MRCDDLPIGVHLVVFDFGLEAGNAQAASALQTVVGANADGSVGSATIAATKAMPARDVVTGMTRRRLEYYGNKPELAGNMQRLAARANAVQDAALAMIAPVSRAA